MADKTGLQQFGMALRQFGAGLNPQVAAGLRQEQQLEQQQAQYETSRKDTIAQLLATNLMKLDPSDPRNESAINELSMGLKNLGYEDLATMRAPAATPKEKKPENLITLASPKGDQRLSFRIGDEKIDKLTGMGWTVAPSRQEQGGAGAFTSKTQSDIQEQLLKTGQAKDRLNIIKEGFKPQFTEAATKASTKFTSFVEKLGFTPSKASKKELEEFTTFARNSLGNINQHIRDRTGAVMNKDEIPRLMAEMPSLGTGVFDGDSATQFTSKLNGVLDSLQAAEDRLLFAQANGLGTDPEQFGRKLPLQDFVGVPRNPGQFNETKWNKMLPSQRKRLVELLKEKRR